MREPQFVDVKSVQALQDRIEHRLKEHADAINKLRELENEMRYDKQVQMQRELVDKLQARSASYANVVIGFGYAGFFALWNMVEKVMPPWAHSVAGLCIGASLALFVGWEVFQMIFTSLHLRRVQRRLQTEQGIVGVDALVNASQEHERMMYGPWIAVLIPTVLLALSAAAVIFWFLGKDLIHRAWP